MSRWKVAGQLAVIHHDREQQLQQKRLIKEQLEESKKNGTLLRSLARARNKVGIEARATLTITGRWWALSVFRLSALRRVKVRERWRGPGKGRKGGREREVDIQARATLTITGRWWALSVFRLSVLVESESKREMEREKVEGEGGGSERSHHPGQGHAPHQQEMVGTECA